MTDNGAGLQIAWALAVGSNFHGVANTWNGANDFATSNQVNCMDNVANNFHLSRVQLEIGSVATALSGGFSRRNWRYANAISSRLSY